MAESIGPRVKELLELERDGKLSQEQAADIRTLRAAERFPAALGAPTRTVDAAMTVGGPTPVEQGAPPGLLRRAGRFIVEEAPKAILPTAGGILGAAAGGAITSPTVAGVPAGILAGEVAGSVAGEKLNQMLGITEPSNVSLALAGAAGPAGRALGGAAGAAYRGLATRAPGAAAALAEIGESIANKIPAIIRPKVSSADLYAQVERFNPTIDLTATRAAAKSLAGKEDVLAEIAPSLKSTLIKGTAESIESATAGSTKTVTSPILNAQGNPITTTVTTKPTGEASFQAVRAALKRVGEKINELKPVGGEGGGEGYGAMKKLYAALQEDLENAAASGPMATQARAALKAANATFAKEKTADELADFITKSGLTTVKSGDEMITRVNPARIADFIRENTELFSKVPAGEMAEIKSTLTKLAKIPTPPPPTGVQHGSGPMLRQALGGGALAGASTGYALGDPVMGIAAGQAVTGIMALAPAIIARATMSPAGRAHLVKLLTEKHGVLDHQALAVLAQVVRSEGQSVYNAARGVRGVPEEPE